MVIRKRGIFTVVVPSEGDRLVVDICLTLRAAKPRFTKPYEISSAEVETKMPHHSLYRLPGFGIEGDVREVIALEVRADG
jgi:hypothetical protein